MEIHIVRRGETLRALAARYGVSAARLAETNELADPARLAVGAALVIAGDDGAPRRTIEVCGGAFAPRALGGAEIAPYLTFYTPPGARITASGELETPDEDAAMARAAKRANAAALLTVSNLGAHGGYSGDIAHAVFTDEVVQARAFENILSTLREKKYSGVNFDFQYVHPFDRGAYSAFIRRAGERLHPAGCFLISTLAPSEQGRRNALLTAGQDYAVHGEVMDRVAVMMYDWGYSLGAPQAVSPADKIRAALGAAVAAIPRGKLLMGLSSGGYNWAVPWRQGVAAATISPAGAVNLAASAGCEIHYDSVAAAPYFNYTDAAGVQREVWFEDARSWRARLALVEEYGLAGIYLRPHERPYRPGWEVFSSLFDVEKIV